MSRQVDERVVSMQFDNRNFEKNVSKTMSTLDKFKQKLNLTGASKGLENVNAAAQKVDMKGLASGVETVRAKFSALEVMGVTALANITNSAINAGKNIVKSLTITPVTTGFNEYELKMNATQTIMASTGESLETVNKHLEELNKYSDQTIYSFQDMTQNIGKFTNAGVKLEDAVLAMKGISNEAALSGANANEASRAMYNFAQALSVGYIQRIDWKSIELANMATVEFKEQLLAAAIAAGTVQQNADGMYSTIAHPDEAYTAAAMFTETLDDQWLTTDVLINTLKDYADETTDIGKRATKAATEVKTFSQMMDTLRESAQSGWARTWEIIFGDYNKGKTLWTSISKVVGGILDKMSDLRNNFLGNLMSYSPLTGFIKKIESIGESVSNVSEVIQDYSEIVNKVIRGDFGNGQTRIEKLTEAGWEYAEVQNRVNEKLGSSVRLATKASQAQKEQTKTVTKLSDAKLKELGLTKDEIALYRDLEEQSEKTGKSIDELISEMEITDGRTLLLDSFKNIGDTLLGVFKALKEAWAEIFPAPTVVQIYNILDSFNKLTEALRITDKETGELNETGQKIKRTFKGLFAIIDLIATFVGTVFKVAFSVVADVFGLFGGSVLDTTATIGDMLVAFRDWVKEHNYIVDACNKLGDAIHWVLTKTKELIDAIKNSSIVKTVFGGISDAFTKVVDAFKNGSITDIFKNMFGNVSKFFGDSKLIGENVVSGLLSGLTNGAKNIWNAVTTIAKGMLDAIKNFLGIHSPSTKFQEVGENAIAGLFNGLKTGIGSIVGVIKDLCSNMIGAFSGLDWSGISTIFTNIARLFPNLKIFTVISAIGNIAAASGKDVTSGLADGIGQGASAVMEAIKNIATSLIDTFKNILGIHSPSTVMLAIGGFILSGLLLGLEGGVSSIGGFFSNLGTNTIGFISSFATKIRDFVKNIDFGAILIAGLVTGIGLLAKKCLDIAKEFTSALKNFSKIGSGIGHFFDALANRIDPPKQKMDFATIAKSILQLALAIGILAGSVYLLAQLDYGKLWSAVGAIATLAAVMAGLMATTKFIDADGGGSKALLKIAVVMLAMSIVIKNISKVTPGEAWNGVGIIAAFSAIIVGLMAATKLLTGSTNVDKIGNTLLKIAVVMWIMMRVIKISASMSPGEAWNGVGIIAAFSAIIVGLMAATKLLTGSNNVDKIGNTLLKIAFAIGIMMLAVKISASMSPGEAWNGVAIITAFGAIITGLMAATKLLTGSTNVDKIGGTLLKIAFAMGIMMLAIKISASMSPGEAWNGVALMAAFGAIVVGLMAATKLLTGSTNVDKIGGTLLKISIALGIMMLAIKISTSMSPGEAWNGVGVIAAFSAIVVGLMAATKLLTGSRNVDKIGNTILKIAAAIAIMALSVSLLTLVDQGKLWSSFGAVSALIAMLSLLVYASKNTTKSMGSLIAMAAIIAVLSGTLITLSCLDTSKVIGASIAIGILMATMAVVMGVSSKMKMSSGPLIAMAASLLIMAGAMYVLAKIPADSLKSASYAIIAVAGALLVLSIAAAVINTIAPGALQGIALAMLALGASMYLTAAGVAIFAEGFAALATAIQSGGSVVLNFIIQLALLLPFFAKQFGLALVEFFKSIASSGAALSEALVTLVLSAIDALVTIIPAIAEGALKLVIGILEALITYLPQIVPLLVELFVKIIDLAVEHMPTIVDAVFRFLGALMGAIASNISQLIDPMVTLFGAIFNGIATVIGPVVQEVIAPLLEVLLEHFADLFEVLAPYIPDICDLFETLCVTITDAIVKIVEAIAPYIPEFTVLIETIVNGFVSIIEQISPIIDSITALIEGLGTAVSDILGGVADVIQEVGDAIRNSLDGVAGIFDSAFGGIADVIESVGDSIRSFLDGIASIIDSVGEAALNAGTGFDKLANGVKTITKLNLIDMGASLGAVATGIGNIAAHSDGISATGTGMKKIADSTKMSASAFDKISAGVSTVTDKLSAMGPIVITAMSDLVSAINGVVPSISTITSTVVVETLNVNTAISSMVTTCSTTIEGFKDKFVSAGKYLIDGLASGIRANKSAATTAAQEVADAVEAIIRDAWEVNSPSKVFYRIALGIGEGIKYALGDSTAGVKSSARDLANTTSKGFGNAISKINDMFDGTFDAQPTIRPVLDLSDVKAGANSIAGIFAGNRTLSVSAPGIGAISASMSSRQNGNNDLVSAINKLAKSNNKSGDTYQINGISYNEGSDVADAINTLVRAAIIEGRA